jgi:hypothetical protein
MSTKIANFVRQYYVFLTSQDFASELCNFTKFKVLFQAVAINFSYIFQGFSL